MRIEKEKILEAKQKLGDDNAFMIAEQLGIADFDESDYMML